MPSSQTRRLLPILAAAVLCGGPAVARELPVTAPAARFVQETVDRAMALVRPPVSRPAGDELATLIETAMDWPELAQFAIGRYRAELNPEATRAATARLEQRLETLCRRAGIGLPGLTVAVRDLRIDPDGSRHVFATADVPRFGEVEVEWILVATTAGYRIADVKALGLTLRQFLRGWLAALVAARGGNPAAAFGEGATVAP